MMGQKQLNMLTEIRRISARQLILAERGAEVLRV